MDGMAGYGQEFASLYLIFSGIVGLCIGSFLNVVIHRVPIMLQQSWQQDCCELLQQEAPKSRKINLVFPPSHCPICHEPIKAWQNIPVLSWLFLRGKCANCKTAISSRYPLIEILTGIMTVIVAIRFPLSWQLVFALFFTWNLIALCFIDIDHKLLPDNMTLPMLWAGIILNTTDYGFTSLDNAVWGAVIGYLSFWIIFQLFKLVTGKEGMGYGDFKLLAAFGGWLGWQFLPQIILISSFTGALLGSTWLLIRKKNRDNPIPFGPYLAIAGWAALLFGEEINHQYLMFAGL